MAELATGLTVFLTLASIGLLVLCLTSLRRLEARETLTREAAGAMLRGETELLWGYADNQARHLRGELGTTLANLQQLLLASFGTMQQGIDGQVRAFGERLDAGVAVIDARARGMGEA